MKRDPGIYHTQTQVLNEHSTLARLQSLSLLRAAVRVALKLLLSCLENAGKKSLTFIVTHRFEKCNLAITILEIVIAEETVMKM